MNDELIRDKLETQGNRLNNHADRLDKLEQDGRELKTEIKHLCENLKSLTSVMKWFLTTIGASLIGFFFYMIQTQILK